MPVVFFGEAREDARKLDAEFSESGRLKGSLHGVPISVKDSCAFLFRSSLPGSRPTSFHSSLSSLFALVWIIGKQR